MKMDIENQGDPDNDEVSSTGSKSKMKGPDNSRVAMTRRPQFWQPLRWELGIGNGTSSPQAISSALVKGFPPEDLCNLLIDLYFTHSNTYFPLLHRPTFQKHWEDKLHETNFWFAASCLMLFAVGSRWCTDERVLGDPKNRDGADHTPSPPSGQPGESKDEGPSENPATENPDSPEKKWWTAGLPFFDTARDVIQSNANPIHGASLFEVQTLALIGTFLRGTKAFPAAWLVVSTGLRRAIDAGAHRKQIYRGSPNIEDELWKRAFWNLVVFDRIGGVILGRSVGIGEEDFDVDLPSEVDDAYWEEAHGWKQPINVPSTISAFNQLIKLTQIVAFTSRTIYAINKTKLFSGLIKGDWRNEVISQLNTALEEWAQGVPTHLKWSENMSDPVFYSQSAMLSNTYHLTRLLIYRPFIPPPPLLPQSLRDPAHAVSPAPIAFPSFAICLSSARDCTRTLEHQLRTQSWHMVHIPAFVNAAYTCAGLLLLALWDLKGQQKTLAKFQDAGVVDIEATRSTAGIDVEGGDIRTVLLSFKEKMEELLADIHLLIEALEWVKPRWEFVGPMV
ncbi:hypothetical protein H1R20_g5624, partial [Candolleomyces eurysporus]